MAREPSVTLKTNLGFACQLHHAVSVNYTINKLRNQVVSLLPPDNALVTRSAQFPIVGTWAIIVSPVATDYLTV